jgi:hypothetical protein
MVGLKLTCSAGNLCEPLRLVCIYASANKNWRTKMVERCASRVVESSFISSWYIGAGLTYSSWISYGAHGLRCMNERQ